MIRYDVSHRTTYRYAQAVRFARCNLRLKPIDGHGQQVERHTLEIEPRPKLGATRLNGYPCWTTRIELPEPARALTIESRMRVAVTRERPLPAADDPGVAAVIDAALTARDLSAEGPANYLFASPLIALDPAIAAWCRDTLAPDRGVVEAALALAVRIHAEFTYDGDATEVTTRPEEAFAARRGVCQDFAQVMIAGCRALGLPAAYVSGYLRTIPPPGRPRLIGADATHAWVIVWCGEALGWLGFDPTNACAVGQDHIVCAIGRDYSDVAPVDGIFIGRNRQSVDVAVDVMPIEAAE